MGLFTGQTPASDYGGILNVNVGTQIGLTNVLQVVSDGYNSLTPMSLSTVAVNFSRSGATFNLDSIAVTASALDINSMCNPNPVARGFASLTVPIGNTSNRPSVPVNGMFRYNSQINAFEGYQNGAWTGFSGGIVSLTGTANEIVLSGFPNYVIALANNAIMPGNAGLTLPTGNSAQRGNVAGSLRFNSTTNMFEATTDGITWQNIELSGSSVLSVSGTANRITASPTIGNVVVDIAATYVGQTSITTLGTIGTGVWQGTPIGTQYGGTGDAAFTTYMPICGGTTTTGALQSVSEAGAAAGYVLTYVSNAALPTWQALSGGAVTSLAGTANQITASASVGAVTLSIPNTFIAPGTIKATTSVSAPDYLLTGSGSGTISILPQAAAGTYNFNLPTTAGTSGYVLTSAGGAGAPMTWTNPSSIGPVSSVSGTALQIDVSPTTGACIVSIDAGYVGQTSITTLGTIATGTWNGTTVAVNHGGTGDTSFTQYMPICGGTSSTGALQSVATGTAGYVLTYVSSSALPTWQAAAGGSGSAVTNTVVVANSFAVGNVVYLNSGTYALAEATTAVLAEALGVVSAASGTQFTVTTSGYITGLSGLTNGTVYWLSDVTAGLLTATQPTTVGHIQKPMLVADTTTSGYVINYRGEVIPTALTTPFAMSIGGTGANLTPSNGGIIYSNATTMGVLAGTATANQLLLSGSSTTPAWSTSTYPATNAINTLLYASSANVMAALATAASSVLVTSAGGVPSLSTTLPTGLALQTPASGTLTNCTGLPVAGGGTGAASFTAYAVLCGGTTTTGALQNVSGTGTTGQVLTAVNGALPVWSTFTGGVIVNQASSSATLASGNIYITNNGGSLVTYTLPTTAAVGDLYIIEGQSSGGWTIAQNVNQTIHTSSQATTTGTGGSLSSSNQYDSITIRCIVANTTFNARPVGSITYV